MSENGTIGLGWDSYLSNMYDMWKVFAVLQVNRPALVSLWLVECHMVYVTHQTMNILWLILWADKHTQTNVYKQLTFTSGIHKLSIQLGSDFDSFRLSSDFFCNISLVTWKNNFWGIRLYWLKNVNANIQKWKFCDHFLTLMSFETFYWTEKSYLCYLFHRKKPYRFGKTWGWVNDHRIFVFRWTVPLRISIEIEKINIFSQA